MEALHLVGAAQHVAPVLSQLLQRSPAIIQLLDREKLVTYCKPTSNQYRRSPLMPSLVGLPLACSAALKTLVHAPLLCGPHPSLYKLR